MQVSNHGGNGMDARPRHMNIRGGGATPSRANCQVAVQEQPWGVLFILRRVFSIVRNRSAEKSQCVRHRQHVGSGLWYWCRGPRRRRMPIGVTKKNGCWPGGRSIRRSAERGGKPRKMSSASGDSSATFSAEGAACPPILGCHQIVTGTSQGADIRETDNSYSEYDAENAP
jgi:hypothetical protein